MCFLLHFSNSSWVAVTNKFNIELILANVFNSSDASTTVNCEERSHTINLDIFSSHSCETTERSGSVCNTKSRHHNHLFYCAVWDSSDYRRTNEWIIIHKSKEIASDAKYFFFHSQTQFINSQLSKERKESRGNVAWRFLLIKLLVLLG